MKQHLSHFLEHSHHGAQQTTLVPKYDGNLQSYVRSFKGHGSGMSLQLLRGADSSRYGGYAAREKPRKHYGNDGTISDVKVRP